ncbi:hypothetical protein ISG33_12775 [Glaciecola sp. MH2013]|uniref:hypothetical protein n=1 Tax=Glaciecola sp. MH2013 TaxID=2785524 RepID=UPI00189D1EA3|nr:hypothetical protein [Glaciecola sp. MH2013]MBF7074273.1 hypothetical protein [Glaciecola sp. MH2013]
MKNLTLSKSAIAVCISTSLLLAACGSDEQDINIVSTSEQVFAGRAIDGYLARATVFLDSNNNGTRDAWESFAFTDNEGFFSFNPNTNTDYCAEDATAEEAQYCLLSSIPYSNVVVRIDSGYDVLTGEPFAGQLSRRVTSNSGEDVRSSIVSPLTSLLTNVESDNQGAVLDSLGIDEQDLNIDYLDTKAGTGIDANLLNASLKVHKVVTVLSDRITDTYDEIGNQFGTPNDASSLVYPALAQQLINSGSSIDQTLASSQELMSVLSVAETQTKSLYESKDFDLPNQSDSQIQRSFQRAATVGTNINRVVEQLIMDDPNFDATDALASARVIEVITIKGLNEGTNNDTSIENMRGFFETSEQNLIDTLIDSLKSDSADITALSRNSFDGSDVESEEAIRDIATLPEDALPFANLGGTSFKVSDLDLGNAPSDVDDAEVEFYFEGATNAISGRFDACVKFIKGANANTGELGDGNTRGELVTGYWSLLGAGSDSPSSFSVLLTIEFLSTTYQAILKPAGKETINDIEYTLARFDLDGDFRVFHSENGSQMISSVPSTNAQCEERLPSRVGL